MFKYIITKRIYLKLYLSLFNNCLQDSNDKRVYIMITGRA